MERAAPEFQGPFAGQVPRGEAHQAGARASGKWPVRSRHHHDRQRRSKNGEEQVNAAICPSCGTPGARVRVLPTYRYRESGIANLWLRGGVTETVCARCKAKHISIEKESQLLQVISVGLLMAARPLTGHEMRFLRGACQMSQ